MIRGFYTGTTGAIEHQKLMAVAANNMANANTDGYKSSNLSFQELIYQRVRMPNDYESRSETYDRWVRRNQHGVEVDYYSENKLRVGAGARATESALVMTQGSYRHTGNILDVMIKGEAFFAVENKNGDIAYTRQGSFAISEEDGDQYLVTAGGEYILDENYDRIIMPENIDKIRFIKFSESDGNDEYAIKLGLFTCDNIYGLARIGENKYITTELSGEMELEIRGGVDIVPRSLEMSNVNIADEMVKVIQAQRAFQSNLTVIRTADEIEAYVNQLRS